MLPPAYFENIYLSFPQITRCKKICSLHFVNAAGPTEEYPNPIPHFTNKVQETHWLHKSRKRKAPLDRSLSDEATATAPCNITGESNSAGSNCEIGINGEEDVVPTCQVQHISCQTDLTIDDLRRYTDRELKEPGTLRRRLTVDAITKNDQSAKFYTGKVCTGDSLAIICLLQLLVINNGLLSIMTILLQGYRS